MTRTESFMTAEAIPQRRTGRKRAGQRHADILRERATLRWTARRRLDVRGDPGGGRAHPRAGSVATAGTLLEAPGENVPRRDLDDHVAFLQRRILRVLRVLFVEQPADLPEPRTALDQLGGPLDHDALQVGLVLRIEVDRDGGVRVHAQVLHLLRGPLGPEVDLPVREDVTDGYDVGHAAPPRGGDAADALPRHELRHLLLHAHAVCVGRRCRAGQRRREVRDVTESDGRPVVPIGRRVLQEDAPMSERKITYCRICEVYCGLVATVEDGRVVRLRPDSEHVASRGYSCPKGVAFHELTHDPDRILHPMKRVGDGWERLSWEQAIAEISGKLDRIRAAYGPHAIAVYHGNPSGWSYNHRIFAAGWVDAIGSRNVYGAGSQDNLSLFLASWFLYGSSALRPIPDLDRTRHLLLVGVNPVVSQGTIIQVANVKRRLEAIRRRGGKVVVVDPRRTETARVAS